MSDLRQKLKAARDDIQQKSGVSISKENLVLADLMSEFVAIKIAEHLSRVPIAPTPGQPAPVDPASDYFYGK